MFIRNTFLWFSAKTMLQAIYFGSDKRFIPNKNGINQIIVGAATATTTTTARRRIGMKESLVK